MIVHIKARNHRKHFVVAGAATSVVAAIMAGYPAAAWAQSSDRAVPNRAVIAQATPNPSAVAIAFNIPAGPLPTALASFGERVGLQVLYAAELARGVMSPGVSGSMTPEAALRRLLEGSGLAYRFAGPHTVTLERRPAAAANQGAANQASGVVELPAVSVIGTVQSRYDSRHADTATRMGQDVADIPRSIDIIPEQLLLDQQARELEEVYRLAPNVVNVDGFGGTREDYLIRGFRRRDDIYRNGVRLKTNGRIDPSTVDSLQIVKGPVADMGQMTPGGLVNIVTKKPQFDDQHSVASGFDEHGQRRLTADSTGAIGEGQDFAYRVTAALEESETFRALDVSRQFLSSSLLWSGESGASVGINYEYTSDSRPNDRGFFTVAAGGGRRSIVNASPSQRFDAPNINERNAVSNLIELDTVLPVLGSNWNLENKLVYARETTDDIRAEVTSVSNAGVLTRQIQGNRDRTLETKFGRLQLVGDTTMLLPVKLAAGVEYHEQSEDWINFSGAAQVGGTISNPSSFTVVDNSGTPTSLLSSAVKQRSYGPFAQADFSLTDNLNLNIGLRYEFFQGQFQQLNQLTNAFSSASPGRDGKLTKGLGLVWKPVKDLSLYASYADTFQSQNIYGGNATVVVLPPEQGRQYEAGAKWNALDGKLFLTGSVFEIRQNNVVETVNGNPVLTGGITSRGTEVAMVANPLPGFNLRTSLGLLDAAIMSTSASTNGLRPTNVPTITANIWASYEIQDQASPLHGLGFGAGISHVGNRYGDSAHNFELGSYTLLDLGIWYYLPLQNKLRARFDLGVKNVADSEYFTASGGTYRISVGTPRTAFGGVRLEF